MHNRIPVTRVYRMQNLNHPSLDLAAADPVFPIPFGVFDQGGQVGPQKLENENSVLVLAPEVLV